MSKLVIRGAFIIRKPDDILENGYVFVENGLVSDITQTLPEGDFEIIGDPDDIVMPGLINTHNHAAMTLFRGVADDLRLDDWLNNYIFPLEATYVDKNFVYLGSLLACLEMIQTGTTAFADGYFFENQTGKAAKSSGIRAWIGSGVLKFPTPESKDPASAFDRLEEYVSNWKGENLITPSIFPHAYYTCGPQLLKKSFEFACRHDIVMQIHVSETEGEVENCKKEFGMSPVKLLDSLGCLSDRVLAAHCVAVDDEDIEILAARKVSLSHCVRSNKKLASGIAPIDQMLKAGINVTIGTDGCASNNNLDMFQEISTAAKLHKVDCMDPTVLGAAMVLEMATLNAAKALKFYNGGKIEKGCPADIIVLNGNASNLVPVYNPVSHMVYAAHGLNVKHSVIAGRVVMKDYKCLTIDEENLIRECRKIQNRIKNRQ